MAGEMKKSEARRQRRERERRTEKIELLLWKVGLAAVALAFVVGVGVTFVNMYRSYQDSKPNYNVEEMVVSDLAGVLNLKEAEAGDDSLTVEGVEGAEDVVVTEGEAASESEAAGESEAVEVAEAGQDENDGAAEGTQDVTGEAAEGTQDEASDNAGESEAAEAVAVVTD